MIKSFAWMIALAAAAGCSKSSPAAAPAGSGDATVSCDAAIRHGITRVVRKGIEEGATKDGSTLTPELRAKVEQALPEVMAIQQPFIDATIRACTDDAWSADAIACRDAAVDSTSFDACDAKLSAAQKAHLDQRVADTRAASPAGTPECERYAKLEIQCGKAVDTDRPTILGFCAKARAGATDTTSQLIALESGCAQDNSSCASYAACIEAKKASTTPH